MADKNLMSFQDAIRKKIQPWQAVDLSRLYATSVKKVLVTEAETGYNEQFFLRENNIKWYTFIDEFGIPTIYGSTTQFKLCLNGVAGVNGAVTILQRMANQYSNPLRGILAHPMNKTDVQYLLREGNKELLKRISSEAAWLSTPSIEMCKESKSPEIGMYYIYSGEIYKVNLYDSKKESHIVKYGFNPILSVTGNICVDLAVYEQTGTWALVLPPKR